MTPLEEKVAEAIALIDIWTDKGSPDQIETRRSIYRAVPAGMPHWANEKSQYEAMARAAIAVVVGEIGYELCYGCAERLPFNSLGQHERHVRSAITLVPCRAAAIRKILSALSPTTPTGGADD